MREKNFPLSFLSHDLMIAVYLWINSWLCKVRSTPIDLFLGLFWYVHVPNRPLQPWMYEPTKLLSRTSNPVSPPLSKRLNNLTAGHKANGTKKWNSPTSTLQAGFLEIKRWIVTISRLIVIFDRIVTAQPSDMIVHNTIFFWSTHVYYWSQQFFDFKNFEFLV